MTFQSINPTTGDVVTTYDEMTPEMVHRIVGQAHETFLAWRRTSFPQRAGFMRKAADVLRTNTRRSEDEAVAVANNSVFGLGGGVITRDRARGQRIAAELIESGSVFINEHVRSDPRLPFGGIKESGYGRELSTYGIKEFVNIKTVYVAG